MLRAVHLSAVSLCLSPTLLLAQSKAAPEKPLPDLAQLMAEVDSHQKQVEKIQENYTYLADTETQMLDSHNQVKKTESQQSEVFYVNGVEIERKVRRDGKPLSDHDQEKENERSAKAAEKAARPASAKEEKKEEELSLTNIFAMVDAQQPHRENFRSRSTIVCSFVGKRNAKGHGTVQDVFKKLSGTVWIDEQDRQIARLEVVFDDNFHIGFGILANIEKGSRLYFEQAKINDEIWLPTYTEGNFQARILMMHGHIHMTMKESNYQRFHVEATQNKDAKVVSENKP